MQRSKELNTVWRQGGFSLIRVGNGVLRNNWRYLDGKVRPDYRRAGIPTKTIWILFNWQLGSVFKQGTDMIEMMVEEIYLTGLDWKN